jgi:poly-gamma-glutamate capsule biosynthesis protein CapA/YwtB (metallophosphatase superfamily)
MRVGARARAVIAVALAATAPPARADDALTLAFVGDVMFGRYVPGGLAPIAAEQHDPFAAVAEVVTAADLAFANLETPVLATPDPVSRWGTRMRFVATPARLATLAGAGFDVVSLANNHHYDQRARGVAETPGHVAAVGLTAIGAARRRAPVRVETLAQGGWRLGVVAVTAVRNGDPRPGPQLPYVEQHRLVKVVAPLVRRARADHDLVVVVVHWGREYADAPSAAQVAIAHRLIDAGADALIGSHPHELQAIERYREGVIAYSLGNFLFDNARPVQRDGGVLGLRFERRGGVACLAAARFTPTTIAPGPAAFHAELALDARGDAGRARLTALSADRATTWTADAGALVTDGGCR